MFVETYINLQILYAAKPQKPIKHTENYKQKHKNQNYRKRMLKGVTGWNMQPKYITGTQKTVHTSQSGSVNVQTKKTLSFIEMCHRREVWKYNKRISTAALMNNY